MEKKEYVQPIIEIVELAENFASESEGCSTCPLDNDEDNYG